MELFLGGDKGKKECGEGRVVVHEVSRGVDVTKGSKDSTIISNGGLKIPSQKLVHMNRSNMNDLKWARNGVATTVINGEAIPLIHERIEDVEYKDLDIIPMRTDKDIIPMGFKDLEIISMSNSKI